MTKWQPIETAPRDGTPIDVYGQGRRICDVFWSFSVNAETGAPINSVYDGWVQEGHVGQSYLPNYINISPTHWMPLPDPPE